VEDVLITSRLRLRNTRSPDLRRENAAFHLLVRSLSAPPEQILANLLNAAISLCDAGSAGISTFDHDESGNEVFRWIALKGAYEQHIGGSSPRNFSPCGITLALGEPQLFSYLARYFTYLQPSPELPIIEVLVIPFSFADVPLGTIWIVSHDPGTQFDQEDLRVMTSLGAFAGFATARLQSLQN
jgi:GAF domain-containing protein